MKCSNLLFLVVLLFYSCAINETIIQPESEVSAYSEVELEQMKEKMILEFHNSVAEEYLKYLDKNKLMLAIGNFGWTEVRKCWAEVSEVKRYRTEFEVADKNFMDFICSKDERMKIAIDKWQSRTLENGEWSETKSVVYSEVRKNYPEEYRSYLNNRQEKLRTCNYRTLEYIVDDYYKQGKLFPIAWISVYHLKNLLSEEFLQSFNAQYNGIGFEVMEMNKD